MTSTEVRRNAMHQVPVAATGVTVVANIPGLATPIRLTGPLLASIYLGKTVNWSDAALVQLNPGLAGRNIPIQVLARSDGSGTTFVFTKYLSGASAEWATQMGTRMRFAWPVGRQEQGGGALAAAVKRTPGAIGYVDYPTAQREQLSTAHMLNKSGKFVQPSPEAFVAALEKLNWAQAFVGTMPVFDVDVLDVTGDTVWPITTFTFAVFPSGMSDGKKLANIRDVFRKGLQSPQVTQAAGYVPVPEDVVRKVIDSLGTR
jgi:phosphate transport system substrate-binding protein